MSVVLHLRSANAGALHGNAFSTGVMPSLPTRFRDGVSRQSKRPPPRTRE